ncbi:aconitate hydratase [Geoalkalibacter ferrihydriticus]|uniref:Aconitate hydratase n=2 Tax=Geoalkalibacter ferrihydriticus TaxID=392333 RepID=A0A0C2DTR7_9BACT|nr:aconitate hydratase AcnA [Geoalkalibacter ferrihydriticus]KIH76849.1 aconitate hydratase [Geoalkalibacter ferrihydriticus DSM 17813]SDL47865.1 aconitate hydratase [Geoalkalibacter ferrihydriticus]
MKDSFGARSTLEIGDRTYDIFRLDALEKAGYEVARLPYALRILLENLLRHEDGKNVTAEDIRALAGWTPQSQSAQEITFLPARILLQDFTGVPAVVDLAAMRDAMADLGGDPKMINPVQPVELVIDHSIQVDAFGSDEAFAINQDRDYERNRERYSFLKWGQKAFDNFKVTPPNAGIVHQINLEYLARVVFGLAEDGPHQQGQRPQIYPDTLVGTDSHTPMVNGLGVLGWGVGGIEAEAAMLGQPISMLIPQVVGFRLSGELRAGVTSTDLVLTVTQLLRRHGVVGKFVEFFGPGVSQLTVADRATIGNMSPEYGATCAIFPVDEKTLDYLRFSARSEERVELVARYMQEQGLFHTPATPEPVFTEILELDLASVEPSIAGPRRPQERIALGDAREAFRKDLPGLLPPAPVAHREQDRLEVTAECRIGEEVHRLGHGAVVIAAITSCTNTSNPAVMVAAGLLAKKAVARGLARKPWVKTSLAPGSRVVQDYYAQSGLLDPLKKLGFHIVGYGCTTCIGNSGPLPEEVSAAISSEQLVAASVLSGNRNFEGRINSEVRANYLMSPPLVVAFALAGRIDINLETEPLGSDPQGEPVYLRDIWPSREEIDATIAEAIRTQMYQRNYAEIYQGDAWWDALDVRQGERFDWQSDSTYIRQPSFFQGMSREAPARVPEIRGARALALLGDSVTTDHISPAGNISKDAPAGKYLINQGIAAQDFNSYGSRRGNHEVMVRGTFANVRIRNRLVPDVEGGYTRYLPDNETLSIYDAGVRYQREGVPLIVLAGKEYGSGSSRDWAAKGPFLQGVKAVIAESYERIHRSNLIGMGILPLQFDAGDSIDSLKLTGEEFFDVQGLAECFADGMQERRVKVVASRESGERVEFSALVRIDTPQEALYYRHGGILQYVLRQLLDGETGHAEEHGGLASAAQSSPEHVADGNDVDEGSKESFPASDPPAY